jgi:DNA-directed RNA polymerase specialized sigma24 family protein
MYEKHRVDVVSLEALYEAGYEIDDGSPNQASWIGSIHAEQILALLTPRQREATLLFYDGYKGRAVREMLGIKHKEQLCRLMNRARATVREYLRTIETP